MSSRRPLSDPSSPSPVVRHYRAGVNGRVRFGGQYHARFVSCLTALVWGAVVCSLAAENAPRPNIIFILADDLGWSDLGCYGSGTLETPNLDRLAAGGLRFTDAYAASSVCSPTRSSILTGKYPARNDLTVWLGGRGGAPAVDHLPLDEVTVAEALKRAGYATGMVGKWHLGGPEFFPEKQGFDVTVGSPHTGGPQGGYHLPNGMDLPGAKKGDYLTDRLTDEGIKFIEANKGGQFFLYQSYYAVHVPIQGRPDLVRRHAARAAEQHIELNPDYAAMVQSLDTGVGRIMATLEKLNLTDRTVVFFFSDNGGFSHFGGKRTNVTNNAPLRMGKGYLYEGGIREPLIVHYPPMIRGGGVCSVPVTSTDFYPTILELVGLDPMPEQHADGVSLTSLLKDPSAEIEREAIYFHFPHPSPQGGTPSGAVRMGDYKLIEFFDDGHLELYNLAKDIGEARNLADQMADEAKKLHAALVDWRKRTDAKLPPRRSPLNR